MEGKSFGDGEADEVTLLRKPFPAFIIILMRCSPFELGDFEITFPVTSVF